MSVSSRVIAIDPSLTQSGWAIFEAGKKNVHSWGVIKSLPANKPLSMRLKDIQTKISQLFINLEINKLDYLVCEGPAPISLNPASSIKVEQVRGIFEAVGRERGVTVLGRLNPRTIQSELLGISGKQIPRKEVKKIARAVLIQIFPKFANSGIKLEQDAVDAILIGILAEARISHSLKAGVDPVLSFEVVRSARSLQNSRGRGLNWKELPLVRR